MKAEYINHYLTDMDVANFARQSFSKLADNFSPEQNANLIKFLARGMASGDWEKLIDRMCTVKSSDDARELAVYLRKIPEHWVPFGHPQISLRMQAPIPIRVQCFKHKIGFVESEESRRYISGKPDFYVPEVFRTKADSVKQGSGGPHLENQAIRMNYRMHVQESVRLYERMIAQGVCPEQARFILPQGVEVNWVWTGSLYAYANFYSQRTDPHAQKEIQELAQQVGNIIAPLYPVSWSALTAGKY